jgi:hypothetical protein
MWFDEIAIVENPGKVQLVQFVGNLRSFLRDVLEDRQTFNFLWERSPELRELALETYQLDIAEGAGLELDRAIPDISVERLRAHGLIGRPLKFKLRVLRSISNQWERVRGQLSAREWFKKIVEAIDAILDSLIHAAGGVGGLIKEFKDALRALA